MGRRLLLCYPDSEGMKRLEMLAGPAPEGREVQRREIREVEFYA